MRVFPPAGADLEADDLLAVLARRVRRLRRERGWSRATLANRSGLSPRFLARVESGQGNLSLRRLSDLARALDLLPHELIHPHAGRERVLALVGLRGAGKTSVGRRLARKLNRRFVELDHEVSRISGLSLPQIFDMHGEQYYRRLEREALEGVLQRGGDLVLATGGGLVQEPSTWSLLRRRAWVVWLRARAEDHWERVLAQGDRRPMARHPDALNELRSLLAAREPLYARADVHVDTSGRSVDQVVRTILEHFEARAEAPVPRA